MNAGIFNRSLISLSALLVSAVIWHALYLLDAVRERTEALIDSVKVLKSFFDANAVMMGIVELDGNEIIHRADNPAAARFLGKTSDEMRGLTASELGVPPHIVQAWVNQCHESIRQGKAVRAEYARPYVSDVLEPNHVIRLTISFIGMSSCQRSLFSFIKEDLTDLVRGAVPLEAEILRKRQLTDTPR